VERVSIGSPQKSCKANFPPNPHVQRGRRQAEYCGPFGRLPLSSDTAPTRKVQSSAPSIAPEPLAVLRASRVYHGSRAKYPIPRPGNRHLYKEPDCPMRKYCWSGANAGMVQNL
jgi:hypothetical protein